MSVEIDNRKAKVTFRERFKTTNVLELIVSRFPDYCSKIGMSLKVMFRYKGISQNELVNMKARGRIFSQSGNELVPI